jgi:pyruvate carboxylase
MEDLHLYVFPQYSKIYASVAVTGAGYRIHCGNKTPGKNVAAFYDK